MHYRGSQTFKWEEIFHRQNSKSYIEDFVGEYFGPLQTMKSLPLEELQKLADKYPKKFSNLTTQEKLDLKSEITLIIKKCMTLSSTFAKSQTSKEKGVNAVAVPIEDVSSQVEPLPLYVADIKELTKLINNRMPLHLQFDFRQIQTILCECSSRSDFYRRLKRQDHITHTTVYRYFESLNAYFFELVVNKTRDEILNDLKKAEVPDLEKTLTLIGKPYTRISLQVIQQYLNDNLKISFHHIFLESRNISRFLRDIRSELKNLTLGGIVYNYLNKNNPATANIFITFFKKYFGCSREELYTQLHNISDENFEKISQLYANCVFETLTPDQVFIFRAEFLRPGSKRNRNDVLEDVNFLVIPFKKYAAASPVMFTEAIPAVAEPDKIITFNPSGGDWQD